MRNSIPLPFTSLLFCVALATSACSEAQSAGTNGAAASEPSTAAKPADKAPAPTARSATEAAPSGGAAAANGRAHAPRPADAARNHPLATATPAYREVTIPADTVLPVQLRTAVGSATSQVEDPVRGTLRRAVTIDGVEVIPAGSTVSGAVTEAIRSGRVKGVARVAFRFSSLTRPDDAERVSIRTHVIAREAETTKKRDAATIGGGAAAGAVIGGILGGGDGAAKGAAIGGGAGTGVVLSTRGKEVTLPAGTAVSVRLAEPLRLLLPLR